MNKLSERSRRRQAAGRDAAFRAQLTDPSSAAVARMIVPKDLVGYLVLCGALDSVEEIFELGRVLINRDW